MHRQYYCQLLLKVETYGPIFYFSLNELNWSFDHFIDVYPTLSTLHRRVFHKYHRIALQNER